MPLPRSRRAGQATRTGRGIFFGKVFVLSGEFEKPHTTIKRWIELQAGRVEQTVTNETTHLICTMEDYRGKVKHVKEALKRGATKCKIISIEWIMDCFIRKRPKIIPVTGPDGTYELKKIIAGKLKKGDASRRVARKRGTATESPKQNIDPPCHHIYVDKTGFLYKVPLTRTTTIAGGKKLEDICTIYLFESDAGPHTYLLAEKFVKLGIPVVLGHDQREPRLFDVALAEFKEEFHEKTGIEWDKRLDNLKSDKQKYVYRPPTGGKPVGILPHGWTKPEGLAQDRCSTAIPDGTVGEDNQVIDPDLVDDTDSGDDANRFLPNIR